MAYMCGVGTNRWLAIRLEGIILLLFITGIIFTVIATDAGKLIFVYC